MIIQQLSGSDLINVSLHLCMCVCFDCHLMPVSRMHIASSLCTLYITMVWWLGTGGTLPLFLSRRGEIGGGWRRNFVTCTAYVIMLVWLDR
jgi:hypothetical protein